MRKMRGIFLLFFLLGVIFGVKMPPIYDTYNKEKAVFLLHVMPYYCENMQGEESTECEHLIKGVILTNWNGYILVPFISFSQEQIGDLRFNYSIIDYGVSGSLLTYHSFYEANYDESDFPLVLSFASRHIEGKGYLDVYLDWENNYYYSFDIPTGGDNYNQFLKDKEEEMDDLVGILFLKDTNAYITFSRENVFGENQHPETLTLFKFNRDEGTFVVEKQVNKEENLEIIAQGGSAIVLLWLGGTNTTFIKSLGYSLSSRFFEDVYLIYPTYQNTTKLDNQGFFVYRTKVSSGGDKEGIFYYGLFLDGGSLPLFSFRNEVFDINENYSVSVDYNLDVITTYKNTKTGTTIFFDKGNDTILRGYHFKLKDSYSDPFLQIEYNGFLIPKNFNYVAISTFNTLSKTYDCKDNTYTIGFSLPNPYYILDNKFKHTFYNLEDPLSMSLKNPSYSYYYVLIDTCKGERYFNFNMIPYYGVMPVRVVVPYSEHQDQDLAFSHKDVSNTVLVGANYINSNNQPVGLYFIHDVPPGYSGASNLKVYVCPRFKGKNYNEEDCVYLGYLVNLFNDYSLDEPANNEIDPDRTLSYVLRRDNYYIVNIVGGLREDILTGNYTLLAFNSSFTLGFLNITNNKIESFEPLDNMVSCSGFIGYTSFVRDGKLGILIKCQQESVLNLYNLTEIFKGNS